MKRKIRGDVIAWALFAAQRLLLWEIPFMPARFVWFRSAGVDDPVPFLAAANAMAIVKPKALNVLADVML